MGRFVLALLSGLAVLWAAEDVAGHAEGQLLLALGSALRPADAELRLRSFELAAASLQLPAPARLAALETLESEPVQLPTREQIVAIADPRSELEARYTNRDRHRGAGSYELRDLEVIRDLIELNGLSEASSARDRDNGDGFFDPLEFGFQEWEDGRLVVLRSGADQHSHYGYGLSELPSSIGNLEVLEELDLNSNELRELPESLGFLEQLETLRLFRNRLASIPPSLWQLRQLRVLVLSHNPIESLPPEIGELPMLEELYLQGSRLAALPATLGNLQQLRTLTLHRSLNDAEPGERLTVLPPELGELALLETLHLGGNWLYCDMPFGFRPPGFLTDGSVKSVYGLDQQRCSPAGDPVG